ncbi:GIY-YIG nuclease family protein [Pontibacter roseus]|uniref:GIY-YIG nuclease family protein n=1 Tax=Pontibacter roseus TaxID=336989 RepID=UPI002ADDEEE7|nr:GIY-YIG nuclease family protein [Pontibacter roseus]
MTGVEEAYKVSMVTANLIRVCPVTLRMPNHNYFVYITTNRTKKVLYIGMTNTLQRRLEEHGANAGIPDTFAGKYHCHYLVYYERFTYVQQAIDREKELKKWSRKKKEALIQSMNPTWNFLNEEVKEHE